MRSEANVLEISKKIHCITEDTNRSTFNADAKVRQLKLEMHPDKSMTFCVRNSIEHLHNVVEKFFTKATAALPMVHKIVMTWLKGESLIPLVPALPESNDEPRSLMATCECQKKIC